MATLDSRLPELGVEGVLAAMGLAAGGEESDVPYTVIRGNRGPRWLLPNKSRLAPTILREWRPYGLATRLLWRGLRLTARCGALPLTPGTAQVRLPRDAGKRLLSRFGIEDGAAAPVIMVGNTVATRKLIVFVEIPGRGKAVIKLPLTPMARASIGVEAETLKRLDGSHGAPRFLGYHSDTGAAMQEYLGGRPGSRRCKPRYIRLLLDFVRRDAKIALRERGERLGARLRACTDYGRHAAMVDQALGYLDCDAPADSALVHGDFVPWNIRELPDGSVTLIDWELARWDGLALYDLCHFYYMQCLLFSPETLFYELMVKEGAWLGYCGPLGIPPALLPRLGAAFLLEMMAGYWEVPATSVDWFCLRQLKLFLERADG
jgi:Phosphotransferase enzyme family